MQLTHDVMALWDISSFQSIIVVANGSNSLQPWYVCHDQDLDVAIDHFVKDWPPCCCCCCRKTFLLAKLLLPNANYSDVMALWDISSFWSMIVVANRSNSLSPWSVCFDQDLAAVIDHFVKNWPPCHSCHCRKTFLLPKLLLPNATNNNIMALQDISSFQSIFLLLKEVILCLLGLCVMTKTWLLLSTVLSRIDLYVTVAAAEKSFFSPSYCFQMQLTMM